MQLKKMGMASLSPLLPSSVALAALDLRKRIGWGKCEKKKGTEAFSQTLVFVGRWSALSLSDLALRTAKQLLEPLMKLQ